MTAPEDLKLYTLQEVANILKVSRQTIYNYITAKKLRATKYGKEYRVTEATLKEFIENGRNL
jgi:excisionase family DNA binding protein